MFVKEPALEFKNRIFDDDRLATIVTGTTIKDLSRINMAISIAGFVRPKSENQGARLLAKGQMNSPTEPMGPIPPFVCTDFRSYRTKTRTCGPRLVPNQLRINGVDQLFR